MRGYDIDDYIDRKFNHLTLIKNLNKIDKHNSKLALFKCDCGNVKELVFTQVFNEKLKTCGCKQGFLNADSRFNQYKSMLQNNITKQKGISKINDKYRVRIQINGKSIHLRIF